MRRERAERNRSSIALSRRPGRLEAVEGRSKFRVALEARMRADLLTGTCCSSMSLAGMASLVVVWAIGESNGDCTCCSSMSLVAMGSLAVVWAIGESNGDLFVIGSGTLLVLIDSRGLLR